MLVRWTTYLSLYFFLITSLPVQGLAPQSLLGMEQWARGGAVERVKFVEQDLGAFQVDKPGDTAVVLPNVAWANKLYQDNFRVVARITPNLAIDSAIKQFVRGEKDTDSKKRQVMRLARLQKLYQDIIQMAVQHKKHIVMPILGLSFTNYFEEEHFAKIIWQTVQTELSKAEATDIHMTFVISSELKKQDKFLREVVNGLKLWKRQGLSQSFGIQVPQPQPLLEPKVVQDSKTLVTTVKSAGYDRVVLLGDHLQLDEASKRVNLQHPRSAKQGGDGGNRRMLQKAYYLSKDFDRDMQTALVLFPESNTQGVSLQERNEAAFSFHRALDYRLPTVISADMYARGLDGQPLEHPNAVLAELQSGSPQGLSREERLRVANKQIVISWTQAWIKGENESFKTISSPRRVVSTFEHGPQLEIHPSAGKAGGLEWNDYIVNVSLDNTYYDKHPDYVLLAQKGDGKYVASVYGQSGAAWSYEGKLYLNMKAYREHVRVFMAAKLAAFDAMIVEENKRIGADKKGWIKIPPIGLGYFLGPFSPNRGADSSFSEVFERFFLEGVLQAMHETKEYPHIAHVEFDQFEQKFFNACKAKQAPHYNQHLTSDAGVGFNDVYDIMNFQRISDKEYYVMLCNAGDGNSNAGNELHFKSLDAIIGENTGIPMVQSSITNPGLLKRSQWVLFNTQGELVDINRNRYSFKVEDGLGKVQEPWAEVKLLLPRGGFVYLTQEAFVEFSSEIEGDLSTRVSQKAPEGLIKVIELKQGFVGDSLVTNPLLKWA